jgi:hypothetical protein
MDDFVQHSEILRQDLARQKQQGAERLVLR